MSDDDPNARRSDPDTSKQAGADIRAEKAADRAKVYATYFKHRPTPLADFEMERMMGGALNGKWRKRRSDLTDDGVLVHVDEIVNPSTNKQCIRWGLRDWTQPLPARPSKPPPEPTLFPLSAATPTPKTNAKVDEKGRLIHNRCAVCWADAPFGRDVKLKDGVLGMWYCQEHWVPSQG